MIKKNCELSTVRTGKPLLREERPLSEKGSKFALTPTNIPHNNIMAEIEAAIRHLPDDSKDAVITSSADVPHSAGLPAHNNASRKTSPES